MTADELERISCLPYKMRPAELEHEFSTILEGIGSANTSVQSDVIMEALNELAERQWCCYALLRDDLRMKLDACILEVWDKTSLEATENLISIIAKIGLAETMAQLVSIDVAGLTPQISSEINGAHITIGDTVADPYSGMRAK